MAVMVYSAEEIVNRAIEIEKKAEQFYRDASTSTEDPNIRLLFENLGSMEHNHAIVFQELHAMLTAQEKEIEVNDPGAEMVYYLEQFREMQAWEMHPGENLKDEGLTTVNIVEGALRAEKETVFFYTFLYDFVPADRGLDKLQVIIREERRHVAKLQQMLDTITTSGNEG